MGRKSKSKGEARPPVQMMVATARNDITTPYYAGLLRSQDDTLLSRGGGKGLLIYEELERDTHCYSVIQKRKHHLVARDWDVKAGGEAALDVEAADFVREQLGQMSFDQICLDLLDATLKGYSVSEIEWEVDGPRVIVASVASLDQRRFVFDEDWLPRLLTQSSPLNGEELPARKFIVHRFGVRGNDPYGRGLGSMLFWPVLFKREGIAYWMRYLDRFSAPIPVGRYPIGASLKEQRDLELTLQLMNTASSIILPFGAEIETFEAKRSGTVDYQAWASFWNSEMSKGALGETLTTEMGSSGARAASETHSDMLDLLIDADADLLSDTIRNQLVRWLVELNFPGAAFPSVYRPRPSSELAEEELQTKRAARRKADIEALEAARASGFEPEDLGAYVDGVFGVPMRAVAAQKKTLTPPPLPSPKSTI